MRLIIKQLGELDVNMFQVSRTCKHQKTDPNLHPPTHVSGCLTILDPNSLLLFGPGDHQG
jgi:hypothetical protein